MCRFTNFIVHVQLIGQSVKVIAKFKVNLSSKSDGFINSRIPKEVIHIISFEPISERETSKFFHEPSVNQ